MTDARASLDTLRTQIKDGIRDIDREQDREALLEFSDEVFLIPSQLGDLRHLKLLRHCTRIAEHGGCLVDALTDEAAAKEIVRWIHRNYDNEETNRDYRVALKQFGRRVGNEDGDKVPAAMAWIPSSMSSTYDPSPEPADMLRWKEDILPMIDATRNQRDAALIAVAWDAGPRSGELRGLTLGDVTDHTHGLQITVQGKMGQRSVVLVPSVPFLQQWLNAHPGGDADDPLWSKLTEAEAPTYAGLLSGVKDAARRANIEKPVTFTNFRKSSASHLASRGINQAHLEDHHGWKRGSDVASRYVAVFAEETDREIARLHGADVEDLDEPEPTAPVECPRCHRQTSREGDRCMHCQQMLSMEGAMEQRERCEWCNTPITRYREHIPDCPAIDVIKPQ